MEVEFTYRITGREGWDRLEAACERAAKLNPRFSGYDITLPSVNDDGTISLRSVGHDRTQIVRRMVAPIRAVFHRAQIHWTRIHLIEQRVMPTKRNLTKETGRTPMNTYADPSLREMLKEHAQQPATE